DLGDLPDELGIGAEVDAERLTQPRPRKRNFPEADAIAIVGRKVDAVVIAYKGFDLVAQPAQCEYEIERANALSGIRWKTVPSFSITASWARRSPPCPTSVFPSSWERTIWNRRSPGSRHRSRAEPSSRCICGGRSNSLTNA